MASGEVRKVTREDIQLVQNLIESCLQLYMSQKEAVNLLLHKAKIEPGFTELVWQKLEEQNQEFFRAYRLRLILKDQILKFNELLERQDQLMHQTFPTDFASIPFSNGSQIPSMQQITLPHNPDHTVSPLKMETMHRDFNTNLHNSYIGASSLPPCMPSAMDFSAHARRIESPSNIPFAQNSTVGMMQGMNGQMIKQEVAYAGNNTVMVSAEGNFLDAAPVSSYNGAVPNSQPLHQMSLDTKTSTYGSLDQFPRTFSLSDLTADFSNSNEILEQYGRTIFVGSNPDNYLDPLGIEEHQGPIAPS